MYKMGSVLLKRKPYKIKKVFNYCDIFKIFLIYVM